MQVDPATGEIIGPGLSGTFDRSASVTGLTAQEIAMNAGAAPGGPILNSLAHFPTASSVMGWNAMRGSNTILKGGRRRSLTRSGMIRNHLPTSPRMFTRMASVHNVGAATSTTMFDKDSHYMPFNFLARGGNALANRAIGGTIARATAAEARGQATAMRTVGRLESLIGAPMIDEIAGGNRQELFSGGAYSRLTASMRLMNAGGRSGGGSRLSSLMAGRTAARATSAMNFIGTTNPAWASALRGQGIQIGQGLVGHALPGTAASVSEAAWATGLSNRGIFSNAINGYIMGTRSAVPTRIAQAAGMSTARGVAGKGTVQQLGVRAANTAASHLALGGITPTGRMGVSGFIRGLGTAYRGTGLAQGIGYQMTEKGLKVVAKGGLGAAARFGAAGLARGALMAVPYVNVVMAVWMAADLAKMGVELFRGAGEFAKDAMRSWEGQIRKPVFGMGYQDNAVAATSRSRGVMAIQNSRLNMRSVLGSEAAPLAAHFG